jgi:hypothetical protein
MDTKRSDTSDYTCLDLTRRAWRHQRGNQNPEIEEGETTQWPNEKGQRDKQRTKVGYHDVAKILLKVALSTKNQIKSNHDQYTHTILVIGLYELLGNPTT